MTRRERLEARLERRREWAASRKRQAEASFNRAHNLVKDIPLGQPILVGHHSERRHRATIDRAHRAGFAGVEHSKMAEHHAERADGLERQLETAIFSDDPDAVEALEAKAAELEAERDRRKLVNKLYRKGDAAGLAALGLNLERLREGLKGAHSWEKAPYPSYSLSNLGARIRDARKRIENVKAMQKRTAEAEAAGGVRIERSGDWCRVTFAEKPERSTINALKAAGFYWGSGSWSGPAGNLPEQVAALATA